MPRVAPYRRPKPASAERLAAEPPAEPPAAFIGALPVLRPATVPAFRVGDYEVGAGFCPRLCGHPGIRY